VSGTGVTTGHGTVNTGIEKQAAFYRAYLIDDRSVAPLTVAWMTIVALWLLVYLIGAIGPPGKPQTPEAAVQASALASRTKSPRP
jgi:hypothetical protein